MLITQYEVLSLPRIPCLSVCVYSSNVPISHQIKKASMKNVSDGHHVLRPDASRYYSLRLGAPAVTSLTVCIRSRRTMTEKLVQWDKHESARLIDLWHGVRLTPAPSKNVKVTA